MRAHKFATSSPIFTVNGCPDLPNSPAKRPPTCLQNSCTPQHTLANWATTRVHNVDMHNADQNHNTDASTNINNDQDAHFAFTAACNRIQNEPNSVIKPCLACTVLTGSSPANGHWFGQFLVLLNHDLLKTQIKEFCGLIMRGCNMTDRTTMEQTN